MSMDQNDVVAQAYEEDLLEELLDASMSTANTVAKDVTAAFSDRKQAVTVTAEWGTDGPDEPAIMFVVRLTMDDDFDPDEWPRELVADVTTAVRSQAIAELPEVIPFYVIVSQRAPTQAA